MPPTATESIRQVGRPVGRSVTAAACPRAVGYYGWDPAPPAAVVQAVGSVPRVGRCCPPTLEQRVHLQRAGIGFQICCSGEAWAVLPVVASSGADAQARAFLTGLAPGASIVCVVIPPAGMALPAEDQDARIQREAHQPTRLPQLPFQRQTFLRRPIRRSSPSQRWMASCVVGGVNYSVYSTTGPAKAPAICSVPTGGPGFAETAWCADYAQTHGVIAARQCGNAAIGLGAADPKQLPPGVRPPICKQESVGAG